MRKAIVLILAILLIGVALAGCTEESSKKKNKAPIAEFEISNMNPTHGEEITFDASASYDKNKKDNDTLEYEWEFGDTGKIDKGKGNKVVTHTYSEPGTFEITLIVFDSKTFTSSSKNLTVTNQVPVLDSHYPDGAVTVLELDSVEFGVNVTDQPNNDPLTYSWSMNNNDISGERDSNFTFVPTLEDAGEHNISVKISDGKGGIIFQEWSVTVENRNQPPVINSKTPIETDVNMAEMSSTVFTITASDPDGDALSYSWSMDGEIITGETGTSYTFEPDYNAAGTYTITGTVSDGTDSTGVNWNVTVTNTNRPPEITTTDPDTPTAEIDETDTLTLSVTANDPDGDTLIYAWSKNSETITGETNSSYDLETTLDDAGEHVLSVTVSDGKGGSDSMQWTITVNNVNQPPNIDDYIPAGDNPSVAEMDTLSFSVDASDPDGDTLSYQWYLNSSSVTGETMDNYDFQPDYDMGGTDHTVGVVVTDTSNEEVWRNWTVTVNDVNRPPVADITVNMSSPGIGLMVQFDASGSSDPDGDSLSYIWNFGDGTPSQGGSETIEYSYSTPGIYTASVLVQDATAQDTAEVQVDVNLTEAWMSQSFGEIMVIEVADVDNDGTKEIVFGGNEDETGGSYTGFLYIIDASNYNQEFKSNDIGRIMDIAVGDLDSDNALEIVVGTETSTTPISGGMSMSGHTYVYDGSTHSQDFDSGDIGICTVVDIGDLDGDGTNEVISGHYDSFLTPGSTMLLYGNVSVWEHSGGNYVTQWTSTNFDANSMTMSVGDIDGDNKDEVVIGATDSFDLTGGSFTGKIVIIHHGASYGIDNTKTGVGMPLSSTIGDPDKDGNEEILVGTTLKAQQDHKEGYLYILDNALVEEWKSGDVGAVTAIEVSDPDQDSVNEIIFGVDYNNTEDPDNPSVYTPEGYLYILHGQTHNQIFKSENIGMVTDLDVGNIDTDSNLEIAVGTKTKEDQNNMYEGHLYVFFFNDTSSSFELLWKSRQLGMIGPSTVVIDDVDGDGFTDIVCGTSENGDAPFAGKIYIYTNKNMDS